MRYAQSKLWSRSFNVSDGDSDGSARERLSAAYRRFWENAVALAREIRSQLPELTLHDEAHFEALWSSADLIAGPKYNLNPLEVFVLGGAILLHDTGHAISTYGGGVTELENTAVWQDAILEASMQGGYEDLKDDSTDKNLTEEARKAALFSTLRTLHAEKAKALAFVKFRKPDESGDVYLIEDEELRSHLGELIGEIAASHHWDIERVALSLNGRRGALGSFPSTWSVDPLKIAGLLRCADAIQLNQARAPDFLYSLLRDRGVSEGHWRAQNRLGTATEDPEDSTAILFSSTKAFAQKDADAWWIAYDAIRIADQELQSTALMMRDLKQPTFKISRIRDAASPERLAKHVRPLGWRPIVAEVRVGPATRVVGMMGGVQLYGHDPAVPLRELIQNASDAIRARRELEPDDSQYQGRVTVRLESGIEDGEVGHWLSVEDDGIGMSERVLVGPLLEFGTSYWTSNLIRNEWPGLAARLRRQTGRFGVGFFSAMMITERILVTSRRYDAALTDTRTLSFRKGLSTRPLLLDDDTERRSPMVSTKVSLFLSEEVLRSLLYLRPKYNEEPKKATITQLVGHLCPCIDCDIFVREKGGPAIKVHEKAWFSGDRLSWLRRISLADILEDENLDKYLEKAAPILQEIRHHGRVEGLAAIGFNSIGCGLGVVGGLTSGQDSRRLFDRSNQWVGVLMKLHGGPRRSGIELAGNKSERAAWATHQAGLLNKSDLSEPQKNFAAQNIAAFGGDPAPIANALLNRNFISINGIIEILQKYETVKCPVAASVAPGSQNKVIGQVSFKDDFGFNMLQKTEIEFVNHVIELARFISVSEEPYHVIPIENQEFPGSLLSCLKAACLARSLILIMEFEENALLARYIGENSAREKLTAGMEIRNLALCLRVGPLDSI
jgi:Histidine kinase-, DNA gyrase B-, and HSP90-like ATPase